MRIMCVLGWHKWEIRAVNRRGNYLFECKKCGLL